MEPSTRKLAASLFAAAASAVLTTPLHAVTYLEPVNSDAGQTLATAQATGSNNTTALTSIGGTLSNPNDADLYYITITNAGTFAATTNNATTGGLDTALFLFSLNGTPLATNDDGSNTSVAAALAAGNSLYANLAPGQYLLAVAASGNEAINAASQLLFATGSTTSTRGQASGLNPTTLSDFDGQAFDTSATGFGAYQIDLTSVNTAVPEPSTWAVLASGTAAGGFLLLRRRRTQPPA